jgi:hypothetical protein
MAWPYTFQSSKAKRDRGMTADSASDLGNHLGLGLGAIRR